MGRPLTIGVEGIDELKKKLGGLTPDLISEVDAALGGAALDYEQRVVKDAPKDEGRLAGGASVNRVDVMHYEVSDSVEYAPFVEFGTRARVSVPADLQEYAAQFKGKGQSGDVKKKIFDWCKRVGIPEDAWFPIFIKIMTVGIKPHPFFFIQRGPVTAAMQKKLSIAVQKVLSKK